MEFEFGTNWAPFSQLTGEFFGNVLGYDGAMALMLEAGFLGIMMFGWNTGVFQITDGFSNG